MPLFRKRSATPPDAPMTIGGPVLHTTTNRSAVTPGGATLISKPHFAGSGTTSTQPQNFRCSTLAPTLHHKTRGPHLPEVQRSHRRNPSHPVAVPDLGQIESTLVARSAQKNSFSHLIAETTGEPMWHQRVSAYGESPKELVEEGFYFRPTSWAKFHPKLETIDEAGVVQSEEQLVNGGVSQEFEGCVKSFQHEQVSRHRRESYDRLCANSTESLVLPSKSSAPTSAPASAPKKAIPQLPLNGPLDSNPVTASEIASMKSFEQSLQETQFQRTSVIAPHTPFTPRSSHRHSHSFSAPSPTGINKEMGIYSLSYLASRSAPILNIIGPVDEEEESEDKDEEDEQNISDEEKHCDTPDMKSFPQPSSSSLKPKPSLEQIQYLCGAGASAQSRRRKNTSRSISPSGSSQDVSEVSESSSSDSDAPSFLDSASSVDEEEGSEENGLTVGGSSEEHDAASVLSFDYNSLESPPKIEVAEAVVPVEGVLGGKEGVGRVVVKA